MPLGKRKRDAEALTVWKRQLMCVPPVSERIATALLEQFRTMPALIAALNDDTKTFPRVMLDEKSCLGKRRIELLVRYFRERDS